MDYQKTIIVGNVSVDPKVRKSKKGDITFTTFCVGVSKGKNNSSFLPISAFGKLGETIATHVTKGRQILVEGRIDISDQGRFNIIADQVRFGAQPTDTKTTKKTKKKK